MPPDADVRPKSWSYDFVEILWCCHKCRRKTDDGATLRYCQRCKVGYCNSECQHADWASHKLFCKKLSKNKIWKKTRGKNQKILTDAGQEWYYTLEACERK